ncbi:MAG: hypothetical protein WA459_18425 [Stellaceae bacterium]
MLPTLFLDTVPVDEEWHSATYPDEGWYLSVDPNVAEGIPNGGLMPKEHYRNDGYREGIWPVRSPAYPEESAPAGCR